MDPTGAGMQQVTTPLDPLDARARTLVDARGVLGALRRARFGCVSDGSAFTKVELLGVKVTMKHTVVVMPVVIITPSSA